MNGIALPGRTFSGLSGSLVHHRRRHGGRKSVRVLVVEDERRLVAEGFAVDVALDGTDGLWLARERPYDVIVLEIMLPGVNGYRLCSTLRREGTWTPILILILTGKEGDPDLVEVYVRHLRNKLDRPFGRAAIQTVRGTGYRLAADGG
jgi:DNA-binding response OmpR family regulator